MKWLETILEAVRGIDGLIILIVLASEQAEGASFKYFIATKLVGILIGIALIAICTVIINKIDD